MSVNNMTIEQSSAFLSAVMSQMSGGSLASVSTGNFTSVAQNALKMGYDPLNTAISQVLSRTIFSIRPYNGKLKGLVKEPSRWGGMIRKINYIDGALEDDQGLYKTGTTPYVNGDVPTPDQYAIRKVATWQSNFYASEVYSRVFTTWIDQLDSAFQSPEEFGRFIGGQLQNINDQLEMTADARARQALINFIGGKIQLEIDSDPATHVVHLFTDYAADTGVTLTLSTYLAPANFKPFAEWLYARIATLTDMMSERGHNFNFSPTIGGSKKYIYRHTPKDRLRGYFINEAFNQIQAMAISEVFNKEELKMVKLEPINFWQSSADPYNITAEVTVNDSAVNITSATTNDLTTDSVTTKGSPDTPVLGVLFDEDAIGIAIQNEGAYTTPVNIVGRYTNTSYFYRVSVLNDFSESGVVLMLD